MLKNFSTLEALLAMVPAMTKWVAAVDVVEASTYRMSRTKRLGKPNGGRSVNSASVKRKGLMIASQVSGWVYHHSFGMKKIDAQQLHGTTVHIKIQVELLMRGKWRYFMGFAQRRVLVTGRAQDLVALGSGSGIKMHRISMLHLCFLERINVSSLTFNFPSPFFFTIVASSREKSSSPSGVRSTCVGLAP